MSESPAAGDQEERRGCQRRRPSRTEGDGSLTREHDINEIEDKKMTELKLQLDRDAYSVDPERVAAAIVRKLRLMKWARRELADEPDRTPKPTLRGR